MTATPGAKRSRRPMRLSPEEIKRRTDQIRRQRGSTAHFTPEQRVEYGAKGGRARHKNYLLLKQARRSCPTVWRISASAGGNRRKPEETREEILGLLIKAAFHEAERPVNVRSAAALLKVLLACTLERGRMQTVVPAPVTVPRLLDS